MSWDQWLNPGRGELIAAIKFAAGVGSLAELITDPVFCIEAEYFRIKLGTLCLVNPRRYEDQYVLSMMRQVCQDDPLGPHHRKVASYGTTGGVDTNLDTPVPKPRNPMARSRPLAQSTPAWGGIALSQSTPPAATPMTREPQPNSFAPPLGTPDRTFIRGGESVRFRDSVKVHSADRTSDSSQGDWDNFAGLAPLGTRATLGPDTSNVINQAALSAIYMDRVGIKTPNGGNSLSDGGYGPHRQAAI